MKITGGREIRTVLNHYDAAPETCQRCGQGFMMQDGGTEDGCDVYICLACSWTAYVENKQAPSFDIPTVLRYSGSWPYWSDTVIQLFHKKIAREASYVDGPYNRAAMQCGMVFVTCPFCHGWMDLVGRDSKRKNGHYIAPYIFRDCQNHLVHVWENGNGDMVWG